MRTRQGLPPDLAIKKHRIFYATGVPPAAMRTNPSAHRHCLSLPGIVTALQRKVQKPSLKTKRNLKISLCVTPTHTAAAAPSPLLLLHSHSVSVSISFSISISFSFLLTCFLAYLLEIKKAGLHNRRPALVLSLFSFPSGTDSSLRAE